MMVLIILLAVVAIVPAAVVAIVTRKQPKQESVWSRRASVVRDDKLDKNKAQALVPRHAYSGYGCRGEAAGVSLHATHPYYLPCLGRGWVA